MFDFLCDAFGSVAPQPNARQLGGTTSYGRMKPHLRKINGVWRCSHPNSPYFPFGATPAAAYYSWINEAYKYPGPKGFLP